MESSEDSVQSKKGSWNGRAAQCAHSSCRALRLRVASVETGSLALTYVSYLEGQGDLVNGLRMGITSNYRL